jgi:hypothetical protein
MIISIDTQGTLYKFQHLFLIEILNKLEIERNFIN